jgi:hypothetical protein
VRLASDGGVIFLRSALSVLRGSLYKTERPTAEEISLLRQWLGEEGFNFLVELLKRRRRKRLATVSRWQSQPLASNWGQAGAE